MKEKNRAERMIESDRYRLVGKSKDLIRLDIESLLREYFCLTSPVTIEITGEGDKFDLTIRAKGNKVRAAENVR